MLKVPSEIQAEQFESLKLQDNTFVAYRSDIYPSKNDVYFEENAVIYVLEGDKLFTNNALSVRVSKGDVLFVRRGFYLMNESLDASYKSLVFFIPDKMIKEFVAQNLDLFEKYEPKPSALDSLLKLSGTETFEKFIESLRPYFKEKSQFLNQFLRIKVQELLLHLLELDQGLALHAVLLSMYQGHKQDLGSIMNTYYLKPLTVEEIAKISGRSLSDFKREFQATFGSSPGVWIRNKKLEHAAYLIEKKLHNIGEISDELGYSSISHFIKAFKEKYGVSPKKYSV
jgi:AraC family transcriptional regulator, exoenzyme S synthesis regulatory protein ExsA